MGTASPTKDEFCPRFAFNESKVKQLIQITHNYVFLSYKVNLSLPIRGQSWQKKASCKIQQPAA
jgi:hypothetical protein